MDSISQRIENHIIASDATVRSALMYLNKLGPDAVLFVVDADRKLVGSLTDGDVRRGLIKGLSIDGLVTDFIQSNSIYIQKNNFDLELIRQYRQKNIKLVPVINHEGVIVNIINLRLLKTYLPVDAVIFAGGEGRRLRPLTENTPKPLLKVGDKPIIEHNIDWLATFGIDDIWITLNYLGSQISSQLGTGESKGVTLHYVSEDKPLGTFGALSLIDDFQEDTVLVLNSDILTNIDYEDFYCRFSESGADMAVAAIPYDINVPYAVLEQENGMVKALKEKPRYTYFSNAGIYLIKRKMVDRIPKNAFYNATDFMEELLREGMQILSYPIHGYWRDIGSHQDLQQAQDDIRLMRLF